MQKNRVAQRANRTIMEMAWSMVHVQFLNYEFWIEGCAMQCTMWCTCVTGAQLSLRKK